eukprot:4013561-Pyramimonas_sp.AAC.1
MGGGRTGQPEISPPTPQSAARPQPSAQSAWSATAPRTAASTRKVAAPSVEDPLGVATPPAEEEEEEEEEEDRC